MANAPGPGLPSAAAAAATAAALARAFIGAHWLDVIERRQALPQLSDQVLLHAGPPLQGALPAPILHAAMQALLFERMASDLTQARALIERGEVTLAAAQDHGVVTPLAQVVSASMPMALVGDARTRRFAPLVEGPPPALRFGSLDPECLVRLAAVRSLGIDRIGPRLRAQPLSLSPLIERALLAGDECHGRTGAANAALVGALGTLPVQDQADIAANPGFVLPVLMAAAAWCLASRNAGIAAFGGNGTQFGLRLHGKDEWRTVQASAPVGTRLPGREQSTALGAIGDSAVIDCCGLGGQALAFAPALVQEWQAWLPADAATRRAAVIDEASAVLDPRRIADAGVAPIINLALVAASGEEGLLGRGFYLPALTLFEPG